MSICMLVVQCTLRNGCSASFFLYNLDVNLVIGCNFFFQNVSELKVAKQCH